MTVLPAPPRLAHKLSLNLRSIENALSVSHLWLTDIGLNTEFAPHSVHNNIEVKFTHAGDDRLPGLLVSPDTKRRILLSKLR